MTLVGQLTIDWSAMQDPPIGSPQPGTLRTSIPDARASGHLEGICVVGIEREAAYVAIARARSAWWTAQSPGTAACAPLVAPQTPRHSSQLDFSEAA